MGWLERTAVRLPLVVCVQHSHVQCWNSEQTFRHPFFCVLIKSSSLALVQSKLPMLRACVRLWMLLWKYAPKINSSPEAHRSLCSSAHLLWRHAVFSIQLDMFSGLTFSVHTAVRVHNSNLETFLLIKSTSLCLLGQGWGTGICKDQVVHVLWLEQGVKSLYFMANRCQLWAEVQSLFL